MCQMTVIMYVYTLISSITHLTVIMYVYTLISSITHLDVSDLDVDITAQ